MSWNDDEDEEVTELEASSEPPAEMPKGAITITINMDQYLSGGTLEDLIAKNIERAVSGPIQKVIEKRVEATILEAAKGEFEKHAQRLAAEFFAKDFFKTNEWGTKTGEKVNAIDHFGRLFNQYLNQSVDPKSGSESTYSGSITRSAYIFRSMAVQPLNDAITKKVGEVAAEAKKQIQDSVSRYIADQLTPQMPPVPLLKP